MTSDDQARVEALQRAIAANHDGAHCPDCRRTGDIAICQRHRDTGRTAIKTLRTRYPWLVHGSRYTAA